MNHFFASDMGAEPTTKTKTKTKTAEDEGLIPVVCKLATAAIVVGGFFLAFNQQVDPRQVGLRTE